MINKMKQHTFSAISVALLAGVILFSSCEQPEVEHLASGSGDNNNVSGKLAALNISLQGIPEYNAPDGQTRTAHDSEPLIAEWVKVNSFDATRPVEKLDAATDEEFEGPRIALMELREDTVSTRPATRSVMPFGVYFRLIAFRKSGGSYVFQSVADYTSSGSSAPVLRQGKMNLPINQTYRFVAYSFNNTNALGGLPASYTWGSTTIPIPNMDNDFLTYDSNEIYASLENINLLVSFTHQLCKLTVKISVSGFNNNTFSNCTGYIKQGGNSSSWTVGASSINANTNNAPFTIPNNGTTTIRMVPFASVRPITVHFNTLIVGDRVANNTDITSSRNVQLLAGKNYTLTAQLKKKPGIQVAFDDINMGGTNCFSSDKSYLSSLTWAEGNIKGEYSPHTWTSPSDEEYYFTWDSAVDRCGLLDANLYGSGWRSPNADEFRMLIRCTDKQLVYGPGGRGMWFMNNPKGIFLRASGKYSNGSDVGSGGNSNTGYYWSSSQYSNNNGYNLQFSSGSAGVKYWVFRNAMPVRCVK